MSSLVIDVAQEKATDYQRIFSRPPLHKGGFAHGDDENQNRADGNQHEASPPLDDIIMGSADR